MFWFAPHILRPFRQLLQLVNSLLANSSSFYSTLPLGLNIFVRSQRTIRLKNCLTLIIMSTKKNRRNVTRRNGVRQTVRVLAGCLSAGAGSVHCCCMHMIRDDVLWRCMRRAALDHAWWMTACATRCWLSCVFWRELTWEGKRKKSCWSVDIFKFSLFSPSVRFLPSVNKLVHAGDSEPVYGHQLPRDSPCVEICGNTTTLQRFLPLRTDRFLSGLISWILPISYQRGAYSAQFCTGGCNITV